MRRIFIPTLILFFTACSSSTSSNACVAGASVSCTCINGKAGAQICGSNGTLGQCVCGDETGAGGGGGVTAGGSAGRNGGGGVTGGGGITGGTGGSGITGTGGSGTGGAPSIYGDFTVVYNNDITRHLTRCYLGCSAVIASDGSADLTYQMEDGTTIVAITVQPKNGSYNVNLYLSESNASLPAVYRDAYQVPGAFYQPLSGYCIQFNTLMIEAGGSVDGTMNCQVSSSTATPATITGTFHATFPP
jgi:hypothetical protein